MKSVLSILAIFAILAASYAWCPGQTEPGCKCDGKQLFSQILNFYSQHFFYSFHQGYPCDEETEKCCHVSGQYWCAPRGQSCYNYFENPKQELSFEACNQTQASKSDTLLGRFSGLTGAKLAQEADLKRSCSRYTGCCVHDAPGCKNVCYQGGFSSYSWWPTYNRCCCDCGNFIC